MLFGIGYTTATQKDLDADCGGYFIVHVQLCRFKLSLPSCDASDFTRHATTTAVAMSGLGYNLHRIWPLDGCYGSCDVTLLAVIGNMPLLLLYLTQDHP